ncbi:FAD-binding oxidoreductase [Actinocrispum wychmicini]|uniref:FAD binding domain-containing protein n=1 Tax=Actinocrispum wychmicini TaxID=1213861 RepID=A0A4R2IT01_9PSEU|nr:FAD-dependent oxidoreductase [Actinocrispum wychmicini]TCO47349.1 FAD binding domain-containing protein [Actinocrispum wychmicini]
MSSFEVGLRGTSAYEEATKVFNTAAPVTPVAAVTATTVDDVQAAVEHAQAQGLRVRTFTTGHASPTFAPMTDALLVRTRLQGAVEVDVDARTARVPAGALWGDVVEAAAPHGLVAVHGTSSTVGVVGYLLRGGISFYGRKFGVATNSIRAIELVTADGQVRRVDAESDAELFWAVRGGGGGFGVVTAVEIALFPVPAVITGASFWPLAHAAEIAQVWQAWTVTAPDIATTALRVMNLPPIPTLPVALRSGPVVSVDGAVLSQTTDLTEARAVYESLLKPLRAVAEPVLDTWHEAGPEDVPQTHMDPPNPVNALGDHLLLNELGPDGITNFVRIAGTTSVTSAELRQAGGALGVPDTNGGVLNHIDARYVYHYAGAASDVDGAAKVRAALAPWDTGRTVPAFVGSRTQPQGHLTDSQVLAVNRVRSRVDSGGLFHGDVSLG